MASADRSLETACSGAGTQSSSQASGRHCENGETLNLHQNTNATEITTMNLHPDPGVTCRPPQTSTSTKKGKQKQPISLIPPHFLHTSADQWICRQSLTDEYDTHKCQQRRIDPVAQKAVSSMKISRFVKPIATFPNPVSTSTGTGTSCPSRSLFHAGSPPEDLSYSLRSFVVADPVQNANVLYTRIAIKEGRTVVGYVPALPQPKRVAKNEEYYTSEAATEDEEVLGSQ